MPIDYLFVIFGTLTNIITIFFLRDLPKIFRYILIAFGTSLIFASLYSQFFPSSSPPAENTTYVVRCEDMYGNLLDESNYEGQIGEWITEYGVQREGYTLQNESGSIKLSDNPKENIIVFIYKKEASTERGGSPEKDSPEKNTEDVSYLIRCEDTYGNLLDESNYEGKIGEWITEYGEQREGYTLLNESNSILLSENPDENIIVFTYEEDTISKDDNSSGTDSAEENTNNVAYTIRCEDTYGNMLDESSYEGMIGERITEYGIQREGYTLLNESNSILLSENPDENIIVFTYEKDTDVALDVNDVVLQMTLLEVVDSFNLVLAEEYDVEDGSGNTFVCYTFEGHTSQDGSTHISGYREYETEPGFWNMIITDETISFFGVKIGMSKDELLSNFSSHGLYAAEDDYTDDTENGVWFLKEGDDDFHGIDVSLRDGVVTEILYTPVDD